MTLAPVTRVPFPQLDPGDPGFSSKLGQNFTDLERALKGRDWVEIGATGAPGFQNGWVNFGGGWAVAAYRRDAMGFIHLKGHIKSGTVGAVIFVLPAGYRPAENQQFVVMANNLYAQLEVDSNGNVTLDNGSNVFATMHGVTFLAEA